MTHISVTAQHDPHQCHTQGVGEVGGGGGGGGGGGEHILLAIPVSVKSL